MAARLVLEWGLPHHALRTFAAGQSRSIQVVSEKTELIDTLGSAQIPVVHGDPSDPSVLEALGSEPNLILIAAATAERNLSIATAARRVFPGAEFLVVAETGASPNTRSRLAEVADELLEEGEIIGDQLLNISTSATALRARRVRAVLSSLDGELAVYMHDNPDPDAIASAVALTRLAECLDVPAQAYYYGEITHQSNRAFVNLLELPMEGLESCADPPESAGVALVDHSLPGINDSLPPDTRIDLIFDHHTPAGPVEARYVDVRESVGATSSILIEYLRQFGVEIDAGLASSLVYGIRTDTKEFSRKVTPLDFDSAGYVWTRADHEVLEQIENPSVSHETLSTIADAIRERHVRGNVLSTSVGDLIERDAIAQAAELLLQMDGIDVVLVYGFKDEVAYASARSRGSGIPIDLATVMRDAFGQIGTAGGHEEMAGAKISLGVLDIVDSDDEIDREGQVREVIDERFFETVESHLTIDIPLIGEEQDEERF